MEDSECTGHVQTSGTERSLTECILSPKNNVGSGHIVYVRRKTETDLAKTGVYNVKDEALDCHHFKKSVDPGETAQQLKEMNGPRLCTSDSAPILRASSPSFSSSNISTSENIDHLIVNCTNPSSENPTMINIMLWRERYHQLQNLLEALDHSDQHEYLQSLQTLSPVELSKHAVELELRSISLSLQEAKEMQRVRLFDVLGMYGKNVSSTTQ